MKFGFFRNQRITMMGIGLSGRGPGTARFFARRGAKITATDLRTRRELLPTIRQLPRDVGLVLGRHRKTDFTGTDFVLKNPGVTERSPFLATARKAGIPIITDIGLFFLGLPPAVRVIGVTGTKGKTTTSHLIYEMLRAKFPVKLVGVPGTSFLGTLEALEPGMVVVAELSCFDLEGLRQIRRSPDIAVVTNIARDHLNRYRTMNAYQGVKSLIFAFQGKGGVIVANRDDPAVRKMVSRVKNRNVVWFRASKDHAVANVHAATAVARLFRVSAKRIERVTRSPGALPGHFELITEKEGIAVINDTCATNPLATKMALRKTRNIWPDRAIVAMMGGKDKRLRFQELLPEIRGIWGAVILPGDASGKIIRVLSRAGIARVIRARTLSEGLSRSYRLLQASKRKGVILFSPAAASFNMFKNEFDRGAQFVKTLRSYVSS